MRRQPRGALRNLRDDDLRAGRPLSTMKQSAAMDGRIGMNTAKAVASARFMENPSCETRKCQVFIVDDAQGLRNAPVQSTIPGKAGRHVCRNAGVADFRVVGELAGAFHAGSLTLQLPR